MAEPDMIDIMVGIQDGLIGNKRVVEVLGSLTAGVFNYLRETGKQPYKLQDIIGPMYDYIYRPETEQEKKDKIQSRLMQFLRSAPQANKHMMNL